MPWLITVPISLGNFKWGHYHQVALNLSVGNLTPGKVSLQTPISFPQRPETNPGPTNPFGLYLRFALGPPWTASALFAPLFHPLFLYSRPFPRFSLRGFPGPFYVFALVSPRARLSSQSGGPLGAFPTATIQGGSSPPTTGWCPPFP